MSINEELNKHVSDVRKKSLEERNKYIIDVRKPIDAQYIIHMLGLEVWVVGHDTKREDENSGNPTHKALLNPESYKDSLELLLKKVVERYRYDWDNWMWRNRETYRPPRRFPLRKSDYAEFCDNRPLLTWASTPTERAMTEAELWDHFWVHYFQRPRGAPGLAYNGLPIEPLYQVLDKVEAWWLGPCTLAINWNGTSLLWTRS